MKRICRQHGIPRWPFRKISKVNRSLDKMKRVMESVNCSPSPPVAMLMPARPALLLPPPPPPPRPCLSSTVGETSSHGSCQAPPPHAKTALQKPPSWCSNGDGVVTIKASHRGDIIRFRVPCSAGVTAVKAEVAKRLSLDAGAFDVKYLDDDHEWVLLSCDADFQECLDVVPALPSMSVTARSGSGAAAPVVVRLMVQEVADNIGSSRLPRFSSGDESENGILLQKHERSNSIIHSVGIFHNWYFGRISTAQGSFSEPDGVQPSGSACLSM